MLPGNPSMLIRFIALFAFLTVYYMLVDKYDGIGILLGWIPAVIISSLIIYTLKDWMIAVVIIIIGMIFLAYIMGEVSRYAKIFEFIYTIFR